jgi:translocation and assembly module TamB
VGLEALSAVSGVEGEVSSALGVIDDIQLTTIYHPVTNRPEPQVTIGKRISDRVRLTASTGLTSETRSVQATAEWRLNDQTRIQAVYDNINRATSSSFGNIGLDLRWRLEFE